jgi:ATP-binding cassette, sub-family E, member 1
LQKYFSQPRQVRIKPQQVEDVRKLVTVRQMTVEELLTKYCDKPDDRQHIIDWLDLTALLSRRIGDLSGGELQRVIGGSMALRRADVFIFDEPSNYLDIKQRLRMAHLITSLATEDTYVMVSEHDLSMLDYMSDLVCLIYGTPGAYGVVTMPYNVRDGLNIYLQGYIPTENMRFRTEAFTFRPPDILEDDKIDRCLMTYPSLQKTYDGFQLTVTEGSFNLYSGITLLVGENGTGKSTFLQLLAGQLHDDRMTTLWNGLFISYKPQHITFPTNQTVRQYLYAKIGAQLHDAQFQTDVVRPLQLDRLYEYELEYLSGGEQQRVALVVCLGTPAQLYLLDEPSAFLDCETRIIVSKILKHFIMHRQKCAFIVEHDFLMSLYLASGSGGQVIVFSGQPGIRTEASAPLGLRDGMNLFLKQLGVTFRQDETTGRPRLNKLGSVKDREQKETGQYMI